MDPILQNLFEWISKSFTVPEYPTLSIGVRSILNLEDAFIKNINTVLKFLSSHVRTTQYFFLNFKIIQSTIFRRRRLDKVPVTARDWHWLKKNTSQYRPKITWWIFCCAGIGSLGFDQYQYCTGIQSSAAEMTAKNTVWSTPVTKALIRPVF